MDRLIAFFAGAVLAFGLGYLVSYQANGPDSAAEIERARRELEEGDNLGLVDAKRPKLKALTDLADQSNDAIATDLSPAEIKDLKTMLLPHLTAADIAGWQAARDAYIQKFLSEAAGPWAVGTDEVAGTRFSTELATQAEGRYQGKITFPETESAGAATFDLTVELQGFKSKSPEGRIGVHTADGTPVFGVQFRWKLVGTDPESRTLFLVIPAFQPDVAKRGTYFAVKLPVDLDVGKATSGELLGLGQELTWSRAGSYEILRAE